MATTNTKQLLKAISNMGYYAKEFTKLQERLEELRRLTLEAMETAIRAEKALSAKNRAKPQSLTSEEDYKSAPEGTIVAETPDGLPYLKLDNCWRYEGEETTSLDIAGLDRRVLRWGREV